MFVEAVFSLLIGNPMLFFLYDSLAADNPQVKQRDVCRFCQQTPLV